LPVPVCAIAYFSRLKSTRCSHSTIWGRWLKNQIGKMENRVDELADDLFSFLSLLRDLIDDISQDANLQALVLFARARHLT